MSRISIQSFFDTTTGTVSYVVTDAASRRAAIIDPVLDYDFKSGHTSTKSADALLDYLRANEITAEWILETHAHADHLSGAHYVQEQVGGKIAIGERIREVQATFKQLYNLGPAFLPDGNQFDHLFKDGEVFHIGDVKATALWVPGHTPADLAYVIEDAVFTGDTLFMPDVGTARADFPGGNAHTLYRSIHRLLELPPETRVFVCHDYPPEGRDAAWETTVAEQRASNIHVRDGVSEDEFVAL
ncbi:MAG: MBL fold metallo-hydrolase, partial [Acidovorax sp.]